MTLHRFVVPVKGVNTFCTFLDGQLRPENPLPTVGDGEHAIDDEFGWVAWVIDDGKTVGRTHLDATEGEGGFAPLVMPADYKAECLLFHRQVLFVGGQCGKEVLGAFDLAAAEPTWVPLDVPAQFRQYGKRIDDLLLDGDRLVAIDDVVSPKYLLRYDASDPRATRLIDVREIPWHSSYETIRSGAIGSDWAALYSTTFNHGWAGLHIALFDRQSFSERGSLSATRNTPPPGGSGEEQRDWRELAFDGNTLLVAAGADGVGVLNLGAAKMPKASRTADGPPWVGPRELQHFGAWCLANLRYYRPPRPHAGRAVLRVVAVPGTRHFLAVVEAESGRDTVVMELP